MYIRTDPTRHPYAAFLGAVQRGASSNPVPAPEPDASAPFQPSRRTEVMLSIEDQVSQASRAVDALPAASANPETLASTTKKVVETTNNLLDTVHHAQSIDPRTQDRLVAGMSEAIDRVGYASASIGITVQGGHLVLDEATFRAVYNADPARVQAVLNGLSHTLQPALSASQDQAQIGRISAATYGEMPTNFTQATTDLQTLADHSARLSSSLSQLENAASARSAQARSLEPPTLEAMGQNALAAS